MKKTDLTVDGETFYDYCRRTDQMPIQWGRDVWEYLATKLMTRYFTGFAHGCLITFIGWLIARAVQ